MTDVLKKILSHLSKNTLIALIILLSTYIINDKMNKRNETDLENQIKLLNKIFYLTLEVDSLKKK
jgi:hypothetical protein